MAFMPWPSGYMFGPYHRKAYYEPTDLPPNWDEWRRLTYQRAGYRCQRCGAYGVSLEAHHIIPRRLGGGPSAVNYAFTAENISNLMAVCDRCHEEVERGSYRFPWTQPYPAPQVPSGIWTQPIRHTYAIQPIQMPRLPPYYQLPGRAPSPAEHLRMTRGY